MFYCYDSISYTPSTGYHNPKLELGNTQGPHVHDEKYKAKLEDEDVKPEFEESVIPSHQVEDYMQEFEIKTEHVKPEYPNSHRLVKAPSSSAPVTLQGLPPSTLFPCKWKPRCEDPCDQMIDFASLASHLSDKHKVNAKEDDPDGYTSCRWGRCGAERNDIVNHLKIIHLKEENEACRLCGMILTQHEMKGHMAALHK